MKTLISLIVALTCLASVSRADSYSEFRNLIQTNYVKPLALDLGGLLGSASAHTGRTLGFPGFWVGGIVSIQSHPDKDDRVLRDSNVKSFGLPMVEVGVGLPFKIDVIVHGITGHDLTIYGGGLRYGLYRTELVDSFLPNVSISAFGDKVNQRYFGAAHAAFNAAATWNLPIVKPFFVAGADITELTVGESSNPGVTGAKATARGSRYSVGVDVHPLPLTSLRVSYTLRHGIPGYDIGLGAQF